MLIAQSFPVASPCTPSEFSRPMVYRPLHSILSPGPPLSPDCYMHPLRGGALPQTKIEIVWTNSIRGSNAWIAFLTMHPLYHLWSAKRMKGSSVQLNSIRRMFFVICSHQRPNDHTNSGPGPMIMFSL